MSEKKEKYLELTREHVNSLFEDAGHLKMISSSLLEWHYRGDFVLTNQVLRAISELFLDSSYLEDLLSDKFGKLSRTEGSFVIDQKTLLTFANQFVIIAKTKKFLQQAGLNIEIQ